MHRWPAESEAHKTSFPADHLSVLDACGGKMKFPKLNSLQLRQLLLKNNIPMAVIDGIERIYRSPVSVTVSMGHHTKIYVVHTSTDQLQLWVGSQPTEDELAKISEGLILKHDTKAAQPFDKYAILRRHFEHLKESARNWNFTVLSHTINGSGITQISMICDACGDNLNVLLVLNNELYQGNDLFVQIGDIVSNPLLICTIELAQNTKQVCGRSLKKTSNPKKLTPQISI